MTDTAEYWEDVKRRHRPKYDYYHVPNCDCGHRHLFLAKHIGQVNCKDCKKALEAGFPHTLISIAEFNELEKKKKETSALKRRWQLLEKHKGNPVCSCGYPMVDRTNKLTSEKFWGCSDYPKCTKTKSKKI